MTPDRALVALAGLAPLVEALDDRESRLAELRDVVVATGAVDAAVGTDAIS